MRKRVMLCEKHGYVLFRCKRKCWNAGDKFYSDYKEECFKCINEGSYKTMKTIEKKAFKAVNFAQNRSQRTLGKRYL